MKKNNLIYITLGLISLLALLFLKPFKKIGKMSSLTLNEALKKVVNEYGKQYAQNLERLMRLETRHFQSTQWKICKSAGMEIGTNKTFPFGWTSLKQFTDQNKISPNVFSTHTMKENGTGKTKTFIIFPSEGMFVTFLAWFIKNKRGSNFGAWYSLNSDSQQRYNQTLQTIIPRIVNSIA